MSASNLFLLGTFIAAATFCVPAAAAESNSSGEKLTQQYCVSCHPIETVLAKTRAKDEWTDVIERMIDHGLNASPEDLEAIRDYLTNHDRKPETPTAGH